LNIFCFILSALVIDCKESTEMNYAVVRKIATGGAVLLMCVGAWITSARAGQTGKAAGYAEAERAVTKLEQEWFAIQQANDWTRLSKMISDDFVIVDSDGSLGNKESMVAGYKEEAPRVISLKMQVLVAHAVAPNAVIASGLDDIATKGSNGAPTHRYERFIDTWILREGRWQCVAEQVTLAQAAKK
jgi:ketosteroid isomerase-like protein